MLLKVASLRGHQSTVDHHMEQVVDKSSQPSSSLNTEEVACFIEDTKHCLKNVDVDIRDAKRRVNAMRPKKKKNNADEVFDSESCSEASE